MKAACVIACLALAGCRTVTTSLIDAPGEDRVARSDGINVRIAPEVRSRIEPLNANARNLIETGPIWDRVFLGGHDAAGSLTVLDTQFTEMIAGAGFAIRNTYEVWAQLNYRGEIYPLHATGTRASGAHRLSRQRQAVELAVVDVARQAKDILRTVPPAVAAR